MRRMLVSAVAMLAIMLAGTAWAQSETDPATSAEQSQTSDPAMTQSTTSDPSAQGSTTLPSTASPLAFIAAAGVLALSAGAGLSGRRR